MNIAWFYNKEGKQTVPFLYLNEPYRVTDIKIEQALNGRMTEEETQKYFNASIADIRSLIYPNGSRRDLAKLILDSGGSIDIGNARGGDMELRIRARSGKPYPVTWESNGPGNIVGQIEFIHNDELLTVHNSSTSTYNRDYHTLMLIRDYTSAVRLSRFSYSGSEISVHYSDYGGNGDYSGSGENNLLNIPADVWYLFNSTLDGPIEEEEGIVSMDNRFAPRAGTSGLGIYPLDRLQASEFTDDLWTKTFLEAISELVNGSPMDSIISLRWFYGIKSGIPVSAEHFYVTLGNTPFNGVLTESSIVTKPSVSELMTYSMGSIEAPRKYNNFLDLDPFTKVQLYIPYIGYVNLSSTEVMGKKVRLDYNINLVTGATMAIIYVNTGGNKWRAINEVVTVMGIEIPLTIDARESISTRIATAIAGAASTGAGMAIGAAAGGPMGAAMGASMGAQAGASALNTFANDLGSAVQKTSGGQFRNGGGVDNETGSLGDFTPHLLISRPQAVAPPEYNDIIGSPDFRKVKLSNMQGYFKVGAFESRNVSNEAFRDGIPREAFNEIEQILRTGVYTI